MQFRASQPFLGRASSVPMLYSTPIISTGFHVGLSQAGTGFGYIDHMEAFEIAEIISRHQQKGQRYHEFFRTETLSLGLYVLPAGEKDSQRPHCEEEVYYVLEGRGMIQVADEDRPVCPGSTVFVGVGVEHRFHSITQDLKILVFWAPPWRSQAPRD